jgi:ERCC4-type nuclease
LTFAERDDLIIAIDTREKTPYEFKNSETKLLPTGDYSIVGYEDCITIERKTKADAYSSLGKNRDRFRRELERMLDFDYACIIVESSMDSFVKPPKYSKLNPKVALHTLLAWRIKYRIDIQFAPNRKWGKYLTYYTLEKYLHYAYKDQAFRTAIRQRCAGQTGNEATVKF